MQSVLDLNINKIKELCTEYNVKSLFAFGSVCTNNYNENSDIDLLISFKSMSFADKADAYFDLAEKFEKLLNRSVDLVTDKSLKNPYFIDSLNKTKVLLYESKD